MSGTVLSFCAMAIAARQLLRHLGTFEILFFRTGVSLLIVLALALRTGIATLKTRRIGLHLWRNGVHLGGQASWVYAIGALPLATVFAIEFTAPIWTAVMAVRGLGGHMNPGPGGGAPPRPGRAPGGPPPGAGGCAHPAAARLC